MAPTESPSKGAKVRACKRCHENKTKCEDRDGNTCVKCFEADVACTLCPRTILPANGKRKGEEIEHVPHSESFQTRRATSSATLSYNQLDRLLDPNASDQVKLHKASRSPAHKKRRAKSWFCAICELDHVEPMLRCEIRTCKSWCHVSCLYSPENRKHVLFSAPVSLGDAWVICPKCLESSNEYVSVAVEECTSSIERLKRHVSSKEDKWSGPCIPMVCSSQTIEDQPEIFPRQDELDDLREEIKMDFELARDEKFHGFDKALVDDLMNKLDQSIYDYNKDVKEIIERFGNEDDIRIKTPLADWKLVDAGESFVVGQPWYRIGYPAKNQPGSHLPITAALRGMLNLPSDKCLEMKADLGKLTFSQVHTAFVGWFVIDVLSNELDIYKLPNMKTMRAMMAAVKEFSDARWPGKGQHALREVQLRTWYKGYFQNTMLLDEGNLLRRMEAYLEPLTMNFEKISRWSHAGANLIEHTLILWSYLQSLQGKFELISPSIGEEFDPRQHEPFDKEGMLKYPDKHVKKKIAWILRRGYQIKEDSIDGLRVLTIKSHVVLE